MGPSRRRAVAWVCLMALVMGSSGQRPAVVPNGAAGGAVGGVVTPGGTGGLGAVAGSSSSSSSFEPEKAGVLYFRTSKDTLVALCFGFDADTADTGLPLGNLYINKCIDADTFLTVGADTFLSEFDILKVRSGSSSSSILGSSSSSKTYYKIRVANIGTADADALCLQVAGTTVTSALCSTTTDSMLFTIDKDGVIIPKVASSKYLMYQGTTVSIGSTKTKWAVKSTVIDLGDAGVAGLFAQLTNDVQGCIQTRNPADGAADPEVFMAGCDDNISWQLFLLGQVKYDSSSRRLASRRMLQQIGGGGVVAGSSRSDSSSSSKPKGYQLRVGNVCLSLAGSTAVNTPVVLAQCDSRSDYQKFQLTTDGLIRVVGSGMCLDANGGGAVVQQPCNINVADQQWGYDVQTTIPA